MIIGTASFDLMPSLEVEKLSETIIFGGVKILLHQSERDARTSRQLPREQHRSIDEFSVGYHPIDYSKGEGLRGIQRVSCVVARPYFRREPSASFNFRSAGCDWRGR